MQPSKKGNTFAFCTVCNCDVSIAGGGVHGVKRHCATAKHTKGLGVVNRQSSIGAAFSVSSGNRSVKESVTLAELHFTYFSIEHNLPLAPANHFGKLCGEVFPDSKIAEQCSSARTKSTAMVTHALTAAADENVTKACRNQPFRILCDGGNDQFNKKYFGIMVRYWDEAACKVVTRFLDMPVCNISNSETLFNALDNVLTKRSIPWKNVVGIASDSANVMIGKRNSVLSRVLQQQPDVFSMACVCHLAALSAAAGLKVMPFSVDQLQVDIYHHFKHSSKRCQEFADVVADF